MRTTVGQQMWRRAERLLDSLIHARVRRRRADAVRRANVRHLATRGGFACLSVPGDGPIEMLLLRGNERVLVVGAQCREWTSQALELLRECADADAVWVPADAEGQLTPFVRLIDVGRPPAHARADTPLRLA